MRNEFNGYGWFLCKSVEIDGEKFCCKTITTPEVDPELPRPDPEAQTAKEQTQKLGCFVAGTLVHTKEGLRPIEKIEVGDYVLAKPEDGSGVASYKRVTQTYQHGEREVYLLTWQTREGGKNLETPSFAVVTGAHPIWVNQILEDDQQVESINGWLDVHTLWIRTLVERIAIRRPPYEAEGFLADGTPAILFIEPILASKESNVGIGFFDSGYWEEQLAGTAVRFAESGPEVSYTQHTQWVSPSEMQMDLAPLDGYEDYAPDSIERRSKGYRQLRRPVFNIEVEDDHTYFVGEDGLWVHNTSGSVLQA